MRFEVDRSCTGSFSERDEHGQVILDGRLILSVPDLAALVKLAYRYDSVRVLPPRPDLEPKLYRLELIG
ncbi:hypothetical protein [Anaeromyxobacter oryzae]|uniref:Uncharacterized protein n=1 Tax=Anaeromyxobacter oryzae TaxID=2918170 RepID=A0ABM7WR54_9BACT|nr:hypothetical protein [Anaeromyxobacter oryzae]BDG01951.1 hypothetical protein AMOR_09470 [Anaeromyxobacter oryzae]